MEDNNMMNYGAAELMGSMGMPGEETGAEFDANLEPYSRGRANTWHAGLLYQNEGQERQIGSEENSQSASTDQGNAEESETVPGESEGTPSVLPRKNVTRRNAWGQLSYSDLIVRAIESYPDQRATLAMIYEWMIKNIPYFHDKGDSNSSAGWKNSIRHNLSLQPRFMRVPNEGTGKSSWWVINHEASSKLLKVPPRRRASTLDTKLYEKRRARPKRKPEVTTTPACSLNSLADSTATDDMSDGFSGTSARLDYRCRANSNASSIGRLSPIQAAITEDDHMAGPSVMLPNGARNAEWDKVSMDCDVSHDDINKVTEEIRLFHSLSVYDGNPQNQSSWDAAMPLMSQTLARKVEFDVGFTEDESNNFEPGVNQQLHSRGLSSSESSGAGDSASRQRGINRLRSFLSDPATQTILSAKPELQARVREMILDKRRQMLSSSSQPQANAASAPLVGNAVNQQLLAGSNAAGDSNTNFTNVYHSPYMSDLDAAGTDTDINQVIEQALSMADFSLDQLPYELIGGDDLLA